MYGAKRKRVGVFLKFCLKHKEVQVGNKIEEINRKVVFKRESFVSHLEDTRDPVTNFKQGSDMMTCRGC